LPIGTPASACPRRHLLTCWPWRLVEASCTLGPALCTSPCSVTPLARPSAGQSFDSAGGIRTHGLELMRLARTAAPLPRGVANRSGWQESNLRSPVPETGGVACSPTARRRSASTPGGTRTRSFRVEGPASSPLRPRGPAQHSSGGRARTCALAGNNRASFQLDHAGTIEAEATGLEPVSGSDAAYAVATRCLSCSAMPPRAEGEGVEPPRPEGPPVFETGYRTGGSPSESGPGRRRTCTHPGKNRELCRLELRSHDTGCDRQGSNLRRPAFQAGALPG
jgi:hypothetical protein